MTDDTTAALSRVHGFRPEALATNRTGSLTPEQVQSIKRRGSGMVLVGLALGLFLVGLGVAGLRSPQLFADQVPVTFEGAAAALSIAGGALVLVLVLGLTGCARPAPLSLLPDQIQTQHQDDMFWMWAYGSCPTSPPPPVYAASTDAALVGEEIWPSGGQAGYECATTYRFFLAGVHFPLQGVTKGATIHAQLAFRLDALGGLGHSSRKRLTASSKCRWQSRRGRQRMRHKT